MGIKLSLKLVFACLLAAIGMFVLLNIYGKSQLEKDLYQEKLQLLQEEARVIASDYGDNYTVSAMSLQSLRKQLEAVDSFIGVRIWLTNAEGVVFLDTQTTQQAISITEYVPDFFVKEYWDNFYVDKLFTEPMLVVTEPFFYDFIIRGYVVIMMPMKSILTESAFYTNLANTAYLLFLIIFILLVVWIFLITVVPTLRLRRMALMLARGESLKKERRLPNEYADVLDAVKYMKREVEGLEEYQKKFVANVSHDFRSPLTSIKGYVEAIKDGTIPYDSQDRYMNIILFETERLTKLTTDLLTLNGIDNNRFLLEMSFFDINQVIKNTAASFEGVCTKKRVTLELVFIAEETYVEADLARIQQVLYNLLDNAVKFSNADSSIVVTVEEKATKVLISVKDFGIGIPKDSLKKIWERFYKTDISRGKDKRGTGLGLSIAKEIITAHNENINVVSTEGVGTEFIFTLTRAEHN